ncbi:diguanylate cyclase [Rhizobium panacihumi]|uniref:GGDEF domain-containing protein n=1 Tax=Rhizobium panacihumi TaxID=2008450 RepID=UPI003D7A108E
MIMPRFFRNGLSLRLTGRFALVVVGMYVFAASLYSVQFLNRVEKGAGIARKQQIPLILSQNRNALKIERAASLIRSVYLAHDRRVERQIQLQLQTLTQSFTLDDNQLLIDGGRNIASDVKVITAQREVARALRSDASGPADDRKVEQAELAAAEAYQRAIRTTEALGDNLSNDAVKLADGLASTIEKAARDVRFGWLFILILPAVFLVLVLWVVSRHILRPISLAVSRLEAREDTVARPVFEELRTVTDAVEAYGALSLDLKRTNAMLLVLSDQDGLTGLLNRRAFEQKLDNAFNRAMAARSELCVLMIDLDHFKSINDTYGHEAGDACLREVAMTSSSFFESHGLVVGRYGGEEFCGFVEGVDINSVSGVASALRQAIEMLSVDVGSGRKIRLTASIGVSCLEEREIERAGVLLKEADAALYEAKHTGRNRVVLRGQSNVVLFSATRDLLA